MDEYTQSLVTAMAEIRRSVYILNCLLKSPICENNPKNALIVKTRRNRLYRRKYKIAEKIRKINPSLAPGRKSGKRERRKPRLSLDMPKYEGKRTLMDFLVFRDSDVEEDLEYVEIIKDSVRFLSPQQAAVIDMRYNQGLSTSEISEKLHIRGNTVKSIAEHGLNSMRLWIKIQLAVRKARSEHGFQWELFLREVPEIFTVRQRSTIALLAGERGKHLYTLAEIMSESGFVPSRLCRYKSCSYDILSILKRTLLQIGIPEKDINAMHYVMKMAPVLPPQSDYNFMVKTLKTVRNKC